jgi:hypothetical protein
LHRRAANAALERILAWPIQRVLIAHGESSNANGGRPNLEPWQRQKNPPSEGPEIGLNRLLKNSMERAK